MLFVFIQIKAQNTVKTVIVDTGVIHVHYVNEICKDSVCVFKCKSCSFVMIKTTIKEYFIQKDINIESLFTKEEKQMLNSIPDNKAYCPFCKCPRCVYIILGFYKGLSYEESLKPNIPIKLVQLDDYEILKLCEMFYKNHPVLELARKRCN